MDLKPWQEKLMNGLMQGRELKLIMAGRNMGKSTMSQQAIDRLIRDLNSYPVEELKIMEGRIYGAIYHLVEPIGGNWMDMEIWCLDTYGNPGSLWQETKNLTPEPNQRWYMNDRKFWFRNERDRTMFILRWSSQ